VISAYCLLALGNAIMGSEVRAFCNAEKAAMAYFGKGPPLLPESCV